MEALNNEPIPFQKPDTISGQSETMQEIVSGKPGFLVQWGNIFFLLILTLVGVACWLIKYPDLVKASAKLTSINAPKPVVCLMNGKLIKLTAFENHEVIKGQTLGYIESTGNHEEILKLASVLDSIQALMDYGNAQRIEPYLKFTSVRLGELQSAYQTFSQAFLTFENYLPGGFFVKKRVMLLKDRVNLQQLHKNLNQQRELQEQDFALTQKTFEANESLNKEKVISDFDYRNEQSKLINKKMSLPQIQSAIISNESQQAEKEKEILELDNNIIQQRLAFQQSLNTFKSLAEDWKRKYILTAPIEGKVVFASIIQENQQLQANQPICFVNPGNIQYFAEIVIPQSNFGKVMVGQQVMLRFQSYPFQEYGSVIGKIEFISHIPNENGYLAKVTLPGGLKTTYGIPIQYRDGLIASAEIVTKDLRLLERFYFGVINQINR